MAGADSRVKVEILGDATSLKRAADTADKEISGIGKTAKLVGGAIAAGFAVDAVTDFAKTALAEGDRLGDATHRLEQQLGDLSGPLIENAENFTKLGQSAQDMLELEAKVVDVGTALGIADEAMAPLAEDAAETAAALALITDMDAESAIALIGKAADGSEKAMKELGINVSDAEVEARALADTGKKSADALTENELAAAGLALVLEELDPRIREVVEGTGDWEQKTAEMDAKLENLTGKIGQHLDGPLSDLMQWILDGIEGWELLAQTTGGFDAFVEGLGDKVTEQLGPLGALIDYLAEVTEKFRELAGLAGFTLPKVQGGTGPKSSGGVTLVVQPRDSWETEAAVVNALRDYTNRTGELP